MKKYIHIILVGIIFFACSDPLETQQPVIPQEGEIVSIEIFTRSKSQELPTTKAWGAAENTVGKTPFFLVFEGSNSNATLVEVAQAMLFEGINKSYVPLKKRPTGTYQLLILANYQNHFFFNNNQYQFTKDELENQLMGKTLSEVCDKMLTDKLDSPTHFTPPYASSDWGATLPMTYLHTVTGGITESTKIGEPEGIGSGPLLLKRSVSKIVVRSTAENFKFLAITSVHNTPRQGKIHNLDGIIYRGELTKLATDNSYSGDIAVAGSDQATWSAPLYLNETSVEDSTFFIIKAEFNVGSLVEGQPDKYITYYYKMGTYDKNGQLMDFKRNTWYIYTITKVKGAGYSTVEEAIASPPGNNTLLTLSVTEENLDSHHIVTNGNYYLSLTNNRYIAFSDDAFTRQYLAFKVTSNYNFSGAPDVTNYIRSLTPGIEVTPNKIPNTVTSTNPADVNILFKSATSGTIEIGLGNLISTVNVEKRDTLPARNGKMMYFYDYEKTGGVGNWKYEFYTVSGFVDPTVGNGTSWIQFAPGRETAPAASVSGADGTYPPDPPVKPLYVKDEINVDNGKIQIHISPNYSQTRYGTFYLSTAPNPGDANQKEVERIKIDIKQYHIPSAR